MNLRTLFVPFIAIFSASQLNSCQSECHLERCPATRQQVQSYQQFLMTENYDITYRGYSPYTIIQINERTPVEVRKQITAIACDYQELLIEKRKATDYYCIYFHMENTPMGLSANIKQKGSKSPLTYIARTDESRTLSSFGKLFPPSYLGKEPCSLLFSEKLPLVLDFYQLKLSEGEQVLSPEGELKALIFHPSKPIKGHKFSQIRIGLSVGMIEDPDKDKLWPKNIKQAYAGPIEFIY